MRPVGYSLPFAGKDAHVMPAGVATVEVEVRQYASARAGHTDLFLEHNRRIGKAFKHIERIDQIERPVGKLHPACVHLERARTGYLTNLQLPCELAVKEPVIPRHLPCDSLEQPLGTVRIQETNVISYSQPLGNDVQVHSNRTVLHRKIGQLPRQLADANFKNVQVTYRQAAVFLD